MQLSVFNWQDTEVMDDGMVVKGDEKEAPDAIIDGILAESRYED